MKIEVFGRQGCALCQTTRHKLSHFMEKWGFADRVQVQFVDMDTVDGLAEAAFRDVNDVPTIVISDNGAMLARWDGQVPASEQVRKALEKCDLIQSR